MEAACILQAQDSRRRIHFGIGMKCLPGEPVSDGTGYFFSVDIEHSPAAIFSIELDQNIPARNTIS